MPEIAVPVSVPQRVASVGLLYGATEKDKAVGDLTLIDFFYLLSELESILERKSAQANAQYNSVTWILLSKRATPSSHGMHHKTS